MKQLAQKLLFFLICGSSSFAHISLISAKEKPPFNVGLLIMATGKYTVFLPQLLASADKYFLPGHNRTYFIFTDGLAPELENVIRIEQKRLGWPFDTMLRFTVYAKATAYFANCDYLFACDADMLFVDTVGDEILGKRVATRHPGYVLPDQCHDDYERNPASTAYVRQSEGLYYFAGGFYGGSKEEFLRLVRVCTGNIEQDLAKNYIAKWHDESHLNRYFIDNHPTVILSPSYCYPEHWNLPFTPKLMALLKDHKKFQTVL